MCRGLFLFLKFFIFYIHGFYIHGFYIHGVI